MTKHLEALLDCSRYLLSELYVCATVPSKGMLHLTPLDISVSILLKPELLRITSTSLISLPFLLLLHSIQAALCTWRRIF